MSALPGAAGARPGTDPPAGLSPEPGRRRGSAAAAPASPPGEVPARGRLGALSFALCSLAFPVTS